MHFKRLNLWAKFFSVRIRRKAFEHIFLVSKFVFQFIASGIFRQLVNFLLWYS